ncbi:pyridoxal phosphate-dependent decarboxylase family protein [Dyella psychrodurans]|uniref:Aspartate aminotransferase family protein n=1 Tax=Dyella psychrodurans TaxID=1927960 RepID=A0A370XAZ8_9GAMM|nr:pyridoxal-dependent decarboxylase [Dyella psychrodurans]RDS85482.1 aspartate aminotransferase family protein [Dyella psychrodurans]
MYDHLHNDLLAFDAILDQARTMAGDYLRSLPQRPAAAHLPAELSASIALPADGEGALATLQRFERDHVPLLSGSPGPRYFGFVTGGGTPAALAADWLVSTYDQNAQRNGENGTTLIERQAIDLLRQLLGWPAAWTGACVTGATMANYVGVAMARQWIGHRHGRDVAADGLLGLPPFAIFAGSAHSSTAKALSMAGLGRNTIQSLPLLPGREALDINALERALIERGDQPSIVIASAGTVNTVDFDDLVAIGALKQRYPFWLHVDAAFGGIVAASPSRRGVLAGIEAADSVTVDAHKWLNVPYDCAVIYTAHLPLQIEVFKNHSAYLPAPIVVEDNYLHLTPENSRRFRALPIWMSLLAYGRNGYADIVDRNCEAAQYLGQLIESDSRFKLAAPVRHNVVCFAVNTDKTTTAALQKQLHQDGTAYLSPSVLNGQPILRAAICNWRTTKADIDKTFTTLQKLVS